MQTFKGRVVYNRKIHEFKYRDVNRIVRVVKPASIADVGDVYFTMLRAVQDLASLGRVGLVQLFRIAPAGEIRPTPAMVLTLIEVTTAAVSSAGESVLRTIRGAGTGALNNLLRRFYGDQYGIPIDVPGGIEPD